MAVRKASDATRHRETTCHAPERWYNPDTGKCEHTDHDDPNPWDVATTDAERAGQMDLPS